MADVSSVVPKNGNGADLARALAQPVYNVYEPTRLSSTRDKTVQLEVPGQGSISFNFQKYNPAPPNPSSCGIYLRSKEAEILKVSISNHDISLSGDEAWHFAKVDTSSSALNHLYFSEPSRYLWISLDRNRQCIKIGHGYMLNSNALCRFEPRNESERENVRRVLGNVERLRLGDSWKLVSPIKYWRLPVVRDPPHVLLAADAASLHDLEDKRFTTAEWLPMEATRLYSAIRGSGVRLSTEQVDSLNYSFNTKGCALYEKLKQKEKRSNASIDKKSGYIRVGMGSDVGDSVGDPFVLELWPVGTDSPIHSHGDAVAVIKVLHGAIEVALYNPLCDHDNEDQKPIKTVILNKGDITWMTPEFYQTHKLRNALHDTMSATIQCYSYLGNDSTHHEHFDYVSEIDRKLHQFRPRSDYSFKDLLNLVEGEYMRSNLKKKKFIF